MEKQVEEGRVTATLTQNHNEERRFPTNREFIQSVFSNLPADVHIGVCTKNGDPDIGGWKAQHWDPGVVLSGHSNQYVNCSSFRISKDRVFSVKKEQFAAYHFLLLDDIGTKVPFDKLNGFKLSWRIETSPGNYQGGIILSEPITDAAQAERLQKALRAAGLCDKNASGLGRWARLPVAINGKDKHRVEGQVFHCRIDTWRPECRYAEDEIVSRLNLVLPEENSVSVVEDDIVDRKNVVSLRKGSSTDLSVVIKLLQALDPDCGYDTWTRIGMAIFHISGGSDDGLDLFDAWSSSGRKYPGRNNIESKWRSFRLDISNPVSIGTLIYLAKSEGIDTESILKEQFEPCETIVVKGGAQ